MVRTYRLLPCIPLDKKEMFLFKSNSYIVFVELAHNLLLPKSSRKHIIVSL